MRIQVSPEIRFCDFAYRLHEVLEELVVVLLNDDLLSDADNLAEVLDEVLSVFRELVLGDGRVSESVIESANALSAQ